MSTINSTKELYEKLIAMPDLHSCPQLQGNILIWRLYKNAYVQAYCDSSDACIDIIDNSLWKGSLMHWHPDEGDILQELYNLGRKGKMLVIKKTLAATSVFYVGDPAQYPIPDRRTWDFGKKKYDFGTLTYLEQK